MFRIGPIRSIAVVEGGVMGGVVRNWRAELVEAYPDLFHPAADHPGAAEASPDCGEGWRDLLERACVRIRAAVQADGGSFKATQIKEKYGTLRFYWSGVLSQEADSKLDEVVVLAGTPDGLFGCPLGEGGWLAGLVSLCVRSEAALRDAETLEFVRIRQKVGILRVDSDDEASEDTEATIGHAVDLAVARSACTCEICGAEGRLYSNRGWLGTRCAEHAAGDAVPPRYGLGFENVRRLRRWRGRTEMYLARYDRETDTLTEIPPPARPDTEGL